MMIAYTRPARTKATALGETQPCPLAPPSSQEALRSDDAYGVIERR